MKKVTVVTVNYNTAEKTREFLSSINNTKSSGVMIEIIIVDNGSDDIFPSTDKGDATLLRSDKNLGFTGGYNLGIKNALENSADYVLVINNDTVVDKDLFTNLLKGFDSDENAGVVVPKIYFARGHEFHKSKYKKEELGKVIWYAGGDIDWRNIKAIHRGLDDVDEGQFDKREKVDFATGCCMLIKRSVFEKAGVFDDDYFLYYEDLDLSVRVKRAGFGMVYEPSAVVYHANASSTGGSGSALHDYFLTRNQMLFGMKYAGSRSRIALMRQSFKLLLSGRKYQRLGIRDYFMKNLGEGSYFNKKI